VQTCIWPSWCHCHSLFLASVKSRLVLPFWYRLTEVVPDKGPLNGRVCVCVPVELNYSFSHGFLPPSVPKENFWGISGTVYQIVNTCHVWAPQTSVAHDKLLYKSMVTLFCFNLRVFIQITRPSCRWTNSTKTLRKLKAFSMDCRRKRHCSI